MFQYPHRYAFVASVCLVWNLIQLFCSIPQISLDYALIYLNEYICKHINLFSFFFYYRVHASVWLTFSSYLDYWNILLSDLSASYLVPFNLCLSQEELVIHLNWTSGHVTILLKNLRRFPVSFRMRAIVIVAYEAHMICPHPLSAMTSLYSFWHLPQPLCYSIMCLESPSSSSLRLECFRPPRISMVYSSPLDLYSNVTFLDLLWPPFLNYLPFLVPILPVLFLSLAFFKIEHTVYFTYLGFVIIYLFLLE